MNGLPFGVWGGLGPWGLLLRGHRLLFLVLLIVVLDRTAALAQPAMPQACCLSNGQCIDTSVAVCAAQLGLPLGPGTSCLGTPVTCAPLKWSQPPVPVPVDNHFRGWNQYSVWDSPGEGPSQIVADDWVCGTSEPVSDLHWWGSYIDWKETTPPTSAVQPPVDHYHILIWTDVPAGVDAPFSHPGQVVWEVIRPRADVNERFVGWDLNPASNTYDAAFHYDLDLRLPEWFYQDPSPGVRIYWLTIAACYEPNPIFPLAHPWGWKTRPRDVDSLAPDAAVSIFDPWWAGLGSTYQNGEPICWPGPAPCGPEDQWDMAFELTSKTQVSVFKWEQAPDLEPTGMDVSATAPIIAADDFLCTTMGPLSQISIVGSWYHDILPNGDPRNVTFTVSLHADIPAAQNPFGPWSMPGALLWNRMFAPGDFSVQPLAMGLQEGWFEPPNFWDPIGDTVAWTYTFELLPDEFIQTGTPSNPVIYWLDIQATPAPGPAPAYFGWKTANTHWNDDGVWNMGPEPPPPPWNELRYPPLHPFAGQSIDLAFTVIGSAFGDETLKWSQPPEPAGECFRGWDEYSVYGSPQWIVADDWPCDSDRPITDMHWWGSYLRWDGNEAPPVAPDAFHIGIWTDLSPPVSGNCCHCWDDPPPPMRDDCSEGPFDFQQCMDMGAGYDHCEFHPNARCVAGPPWVCEPRQEFSHPGQMIVDFVVPRSALGERPVGCDSIDPMVAPDTCFHYDYAPDAILFAQPDPACTIYWVSIAAMYFGGPGDIEHPWGWKTREHLYQDDAVRIFAPTAPLPGTFYQAGEPILGPDGLSWDMAFALTAGPSCTPNPPTTVDAVCFNGQTPTLIPCTQNSDCAVGQACRLKSRFLSINPTLAVGSTALQVRVISVPNAWPAVNGPPYNYPAMVGDVWWVGPATSRVNDQVPYITAPLQCTGTPLTQDWSLVGNIHIYGDAVVPGARYEIRACCGVGGPCSSPLALSTARHGDVRTLYNVTDFADISALVGEFQTPNAPTSLLKSHAWITPSNMTTTMAAPYGFNQISAGVTAFSGGPPPAPVLGANQCP